MIKVYMDEFKVSESEDKFMLTIPETSISFPDGRFLILKARIKVRGVIWEVHKNDSDPFPSNPHAHNYEDGTKLDLSNGTIYKGRQPYKRIDSKALEVIQQELRQRGFQI